MATGQNTAFGTLLRRYRTLAGLTQEQLAERAGVSVRAITALERGVNRTPQRDTFRLLAAALPLTPAEQAAFEAAARRQPLRMAAGQRGPARHDHIARSPFVGRARELAALQQCLDGVGPPLVLLNGEPGIGKTRLLQEAAQAASARGMIILEGGCHWHTCQEPYAPLTSALERYLAEKSYAQRRADLRGCAWLTRLLPEVEEITGASTSSSPLAVEQERRLTFNAVVRFLTNIREPAGTLLLIDDLQWVGPDVTDLLLHLLRAAPGIGLRVITAYRDTDGQIPPPLAATIIQLVRDGEAERLELGPLAAPEAEELLARLFEGLRDGRSEGDAAEGESAPTPQPTQALLLARAEGVPFYLVSCALAVRAGAMSQGLSDVPWDVEQSIRQRLAMLPETAQELAAIAAVVGQEAPGKLLAWASGYPRRETQAALDALCRARMLVEDGTGTYRFSHDLIRDVVIAELGATRRQMLHGRIAEALERDNNSEQWLEALVYHYMRSEERARALVYLERAANQALAQGAERTATLFFGQQADVLRALGRIHDEAHLREELAVLSDRFGWHDAALYHLTRAADLYRETGDIEALRRVAAQIERSEARQGDEGESPTR